jgi:hypothetical protein
VRLTQVAFLEMVTESRSSEEHEIAGHTFHVGTVRFTILRQASFLLRQNSKVLKHFGHHQHEECQPRAYGKTHPQEQDKQHHDLRMAGYPVEPPGHRLIEGCVFEIENGDDESNQAKGIQNHPQEKEAGSDLQRSEDDQNQAGKGKQLPYDSKNPLPSIPSGPIKKPGYHILWKSLQQKTLYQAQQAQWNPSIEPSYFEGGN